MEISLKEIYGIQVLSVAGTLSAHNVKVLNAGITKLFKSGKNKIVLNFSKLPDLETESVREIVQLNTVARELAGELVLTGLSKQLKDRVSTFAKPPILMSFDTDEQAVEFLRGQKVHFSGSPEAEAALKQKDQEIAELKKKIEALDPAKFQSMVADKSNAERENQWLHSQLDEFLKVERKPPTPTAAEEKLKELEKRIEDIVHGTAGKPATEKKQADGKK